MKSLIPFTEPKTESQYLNSVLKLSLNGLTTITDGQAHSLSELQTLELNSLTSITDAQAESLSSVFNLSLNGLTSINDEQAWSLSKVENLSISETCKQLFKEYIAKSYAEKEKLLNGIAVNGIITDEQAKFLSGFDPLVLDGLTSITDAQAESLSKVNYLSVTD